MTSLNILAQAAAFWQGKSPNKPTAEQVVTALLECEKTAKKDKKISDFADFQGNWRLCFITGTKKTRQKAGKVLGAGRYLPGWVQIQLSYSQSGDETNPASGYMAGEIGNRVQLGGLDLSLTGPAKLLDKNNILAFAFTKMTVKLGGVQLYNGFIRGGGDDYGKFYQETVKKQAFFAYFIVTPEFIAARGRGGGLALWGRIN